MQQTEHSMAQAEGEQMPEASDPQRGKDLAIAIETAEVHNEQGEPRMFDGIWLGSDARA